MVGEGGGRAPTTGRSGPENVRSPSRAPWADERRRIWCGWATGSPPPDVVGASSTSSQQPAAAASSTGLRDTREGGERGARGGSSAGGQPEGGPCPSGRPHDFPAATAWARWCWLLPGGALLLLPGPCARDPGLATRSCAAAEGARRPSRPLASQARPATLPGGVADLGGCRGQRGIQRPDARSTIAVESKIGVDFGGSLRCLQWLFGGGAKG